jgi:hypothetical protein
MIKDGVQKFLDGDIPIGGNMSSEEVNELLRKKKVADVTITIEAKCGSKELGGYERVFTIGLSDEAVKSSEKLLEGNLDNVKSQVAKLMRTWKEEMG